MSLKSKRINDKVKLFRISPTEPFKESNDTNIVEPERKVQIHRNRIVGIRARQNLHNRNQPATFDEMFGHIENDEIKDLSHHEVLSKEVKFDDKNINDFVIKSERNKGIINRTESPKTNPSRLKTRTELKENEHIKTFEHELVTSDQGRQVEKYFPARDKTKLAENIKEIQSIAGKANTTDNTVLENALRHAELTWSRDPFRKLNISPRTPVFDIDFSKNPAEKRKKNAAKELSQRVLVRKPNHNIIKTFSVQKTGPVKSIYHTKEKLLKKDKTKFSIEDLTWTPALLRRNRKA